MIKVLAVDFGGVYFTWDWESYWSDLSKVTHAPVHVLKRTPSRIREYQVNKISHKEFWDSFCKELGVSVPHAVLSKVVKKQFKPNKPVIQLLKVLKKKHTLVLFANQTDMLDQFNQKHAFYDNFHHILNSFEVGVQKPDKEMFDLLLAKTKAKSQEILVIDDTPLNIESAQQLGFQTLLFSQKVDLAKELKRVCVL